MAEQSGAVLAEAIGLETRDDKAIVRVRITNPYTNFVEMEFAVERVEDTNKLLESVRLQLYEFAEALRNAVGDKYSLQITKQ
jgi:hypothetical protein